ncbi:MAG: PilW family protein [Gammaproteobacteria bacterium]
MIRIPKLRQYVFGLTLLEMLVALVVGLILMTGIIQLLVNSNNAFRMQNSLSRVQEDGQFAIEYLADNVRNTDFWGCLEDTTWVVNHLNTGGSVYFTFTSGLQGTANQASGGSIVAGSDTITISSSTPVSGLNQVITPFGPATTSPVTTNPSTNLAQGSIVLVSDCLVGDIFQVTNTTASAGSLEHATGVGAPGNASAALSKVYSSGAFVYLPYTITYSIQTDANGEPGLFLTNATGSQEIVGNVENMIILYGEDTDSDGTANRYVRANQVTNMQNVVSVRISIVVRSSDNNIVTTPQPYVLNYQTITPTDNKLRRVYTTTITLRNRLN